MLHGSLGPTTKREQACLPTKRQSKWPRKFDSCHKLTKAAERISLSLFFDCSHIVMMAVWSVVFSYFKMESAYGMLTTCWSKLVLSSCDPQLPIPVQMMEMECHHPSGYWQTQVVNCPTPTCSGTLREHATPFADLNCPRMQWHY